MATSRCSSRKECVRNILADAGQLIALLPKSAHHRATVRWIAANTHRLLSTWPGVTGGPMASTQDMPGKPDGCTTWPVRLVSRPKLLLDGETVEVAIDVGDRDVERLSMRRDQAIENRSTVAFDFMAGEQRGGAGGGLGVEIQDRKSGNSRANLRTVVRPSIAKPEVIFSSIREIAEIATSRALNVTNRSRISGSFAP